MDPMERQPGVRLEGDVKNAPDYAQDGNAANRDGMQSQAQEAADRAREAAGNVATTARDTAENMTERARETAENMGDRARDMEERGREEASSKLESVADQLRERAAGDGTKGEMAEKAAMTMERTAGYLREHSTGDMTSDLETYVRDHPMQGVAAAVVAGFVIGRVLR
jgi:ElaB/YqjD/DUF883 family membrane-anchored ribosome-binding protein